MKNTNSLEGWKNRHTEALPTEPCHIKIRILQPEAEGYEVAVCRWVPCSTDQLMKPHKGFLGTAYGAPITPVTKYWTLWAKSTVGYRVWEQNDNEFVYYQVIS